MLGQSLSIPNLLSGVRIIDVIKRKKSNKYKASEVSSLVIYDSRRPLSTYDITSRSIRVVVCQEFPSRLHPQITYIKVDSLFEAKGIISANLHGWPSRKLSLIAVTGTNGKTTVVNLLYELFTKLGYKAGVISTLGVKVSGASCPRKEGRPNINKLLARMVSEGCQYCFLECHSYGLAYKGQAAGLHIKGAAILNVTHDHLDVHGSFEDYFKVKKSLFDRLSSDAFALFNADDKSGKNLIKDTIAQSFSFGIHNTADFTVKVTSDSLKGLKLLLEESNLQCRLVGAFNAYNMLAAYAISKLLGVSSDKIIPQLPALAPVEGHIQTVPTLREYHCFVDFAHNPDGLENILNALNTAKETANKLICVIGCGGNKDKTKRPIMANIAVKNSTIVIFTSDNPRDEDPSLIIDDMKRGITESDKKQTLSIVDRKEAIKAACMLASKGDFVLVVGKGHEKYQEYRGEKRDFDDVEVLEKVANSSIASEN